MAHILCGTTVARKYRPTSEILARLSRAGIERIEAAFFDRLFSVRDRAEMRAMASAVATSAVECKSVHLDFGEDADISVVDGTERAKRVEEACYAISMATTFGADIAVIHGSDEPIGPAERPQRLANLKTSLRDLCDAATADGVRLALELLPRTCLANTCDEALELLAGLPEQVIGFCVDVNHVNLREDPATVVRKLSGRILTFHISDNDGIDERHWFPFDGVIDWPSFMRAVRDVGYEGQFIFETGGSFRDDVNEYLAELRGRFDRLMAL